jgi:hypothetical protein
MAGSTAPATVLGLHVYPVKGAPGRDLEDALVGEEGLEGDRRKKSPVHLVALQDADPSIRANLVLSMDPGELAGAVGAVLRVGEVELTVSGPAGDCPGVYAGVRRGGTVHVGDSATIVGEPA